jgi:uncharacterized protein (DUF1800 family)
MRSVIRHYKYHSEANLVSGYSLSKINDWDDKAAIHILSRTLFGFTQEDIDFALSISLDEFVDNYLLADKPNPQAPFWVNDSSSDNSTERTRELTYWWYNHMLTQGYSFREKMVLFWHNHFVSEVDKVNLPQRMYWQNKLFREYAFGNIRELTKKITIDPAMLIYLDGNKNRKGAPNENFGRELMELFTMGIGNYTETDIQEAARALTGWRVEGVTSYFTESRFDEGDKTILGETGNFGYEDVVDIIFRQDVTARYFCRQLYKEFIYIVPDENFVNELSNILRQNDYELKPVLSALLKSSYFHAEEIRGSKIKNPVEFVVQAMKQFNISTPDYSYLRQVAEQLEQRLFDPPNVSGWDGDKRWINTNTLPARHTFTDSVAEGEKPNGSDLTFEVNLVDYARTFPSAERAEDFIEDVSRIFIQFPLSDKRKTYLLDTLLDGAEVYDWSTYDPQAENRLRLFFKALFRLSEYQLS